MCESKSEKLFLIKFDPKLTFGNHISDYEKKLVKKLML